METDAEKKPVEKHHVQENLCETRPPYRQGKKLTAVKTYTVALESQHLFIYGVPQINLRPELKSLCMRYGPIKNLHAVTDCETEIFTECYHVQYERIQSARIAKRIMDNRSFYGHPLHVCYAPEHETLQETRAKLNQRRLEVARKVDNDNNGRYDRGVKKNTQNCIDEIEDPILAKRLCRRDPPGGSQIKVYPQSVKETFKMIEENLFYGPLLEDFERFKRNIRFEDEPTDEPSTSVEAADEKQDETVFVPSQVVKTNLNVCAKRIVFKEKEFGLQQ